MGARVDKAKQFYDEGMSHFENESFIAATNTLRLAVNYDPNNADYVSALTMSEEQMRQAKADGQWKRGYIQESLGHINEAISAYLEAAEVLPRPDYCAHIAQLLLKYDQDLHTAAKHAQTAVDGAPRNVDYRLILGRIYEHAGLPRKAYAAFEKALEIEPKNDEANGPSNGSNSRGEVASMERIIGIDLGTTNSCVAIVDGDTPVVLTNQVVQNDPFGGCGIRER